MRRRDFLKRATVFSALAPVLPVLSASAQGPSGTLRILADRPELVYGQVGTLLAELGLNAGTVSVRSAQLDGAYQGDLVVVQAGQLVDYRHVDSSAAEASRALVQSLDLYRPVENPTLLTFRYGMGFVQGHGATVLVDGQPVQRLDLRQDLAALKVEGVGGHVIISVKQGVARVDDATCRHRTCMKMGSASSPGDELLCVPTRVRVVIDGQKYLGIDAVSR